MKNKLRKEKLNILTAIALAISLVAFLSYYVRVKSPERGNESPTEASKEEPKDKGEGASKEADDSKAYDTPTLGSLTGSDPLEKNYPPDVTSDEAINSLRFIKNDNWMFFSIRDRKNNSSLYRTRPDGSTLIKRLFSKNVSQISLMNNKIFFSDSYGVLYSSDLTGTELVKIRGYNYKPEGYISDIHAYKSRIYFAENYTIASVDEFGEDFQTILTSIWQCEIISIENDIIYYFYADQSKFYEKSYISSYNINTKEKGPTYEIDYIRIYPPGLIRKNGDFIYYSHFSYDAHNQKETWSIRRLSLQNGKDETVISPKNLIPYAYIPHKNQLYYTTTEGIFEYSFESYSSRSIVAFDSKKQYEHNELYIYDNTLYTLLNYSIASDNTNLADKEYVSLLKISLGNNYEASYTYLYAQKNIKLNQ